MKFANNYYQSDKQYISRQIIIYLLGMPIFILFWILDAIYIIKSIYFLIPILLILSYYSLFGFFSQQKWFKKYSRIIYEIDVEQELIHFTTTKILWKKAQSMKIEYKDVKLKKIFMYWWAKKGIEKTTYILIAEGKEYYLISDYFDEIDEIVQKIESKIIV